MNDDRTAPLRQALATVAEAADYLNVSRSSVYLLMDRGELRFVKLGKCRRLPWSELERLVEKNLVGG